MQNYEELKEMLSLILLKIEKLSTKIDMLEGKVGSSSNVNQPPMPTGYHYDNDRTSPAGDVKKEIENMRAEFMKKHQAKMREVREMEKKLPVDKVKVTIDNSEDSDN